MKKPQESAGRRILRALDRHVRGRGRGAIRALDRATGHSEGWWQHRVASGDIPFQQMIDVLEHLGLDPVSFVRRELGDDEGLDLDPAAGEPPPIVFRARQRLAAGPQGGALGEEYLKLLDRERSEKAAWVVEQALWAVESLEPSLLPRLLGVAGSAYRLLLALEEGRHAVLEGLEMARRLRQPATVAELLQRLSYLVADDGDLGEALRLAELATLRFLRLGDSAGLGKALVDQGMWLHYLGRHEESAELETRALALLPPGHARNRLTALNLLGLCQRQLGRLDESLDFLRQAERLAAETGASRGDRAKVAWLRAELQADLGDPGPAEAALQEVATCFRPLHLGETALVTCDLVRVQLLQGRPGAAFETASGLLPLLEPLRGNAVVSAAIAELLRRGREGLTLALVEAVKARIEGERLHRETWRALAVEGTSP